MDQPIQLVFRLEPSQRRVIPQDGEAELLVAAATLLLQIVDAEEEEGTGDEHHP